LQEYLPIGGDPTFCSLSQQLAFGSDCQARREGRIATVQTLSGTGALRVGAEYLAAWYPVKQVLLPNPTWGNHKAIFGAAGLRLGQYRYFEPSTKGLDYQVRGWGLWRGRKGGRLEREQVEPSVCLVGAGEGGQGRTGRLRIKWVGGSREAVAAKQQEHGTAKVRAKNCFLLHVVLRGGCCGQEERGFAF
jgi:hypothetical protein